ncbi:MAG: GDP-mannose 4,6-dehydratase, partial [Verrucomicrobiota bacterium]|nr:GDP-mannose 4,6-dehydratase [Verrucomicrobiota bacterium]
MKRALVTGVTGQDGAYLAELLLNHGYEVHGMLRRSSRMERPRIDALEHFREETPPRLHLHYGELSDAGNLTHLLYQIRPDEIYNLAGQSSVRVSFEMAEYTCDSNAMGVVRLLEGIVKSGLSKQTRFYQASSSEMFGRVAALPITENTPFSPKSPYACSKIMAHHLAGHYREAHGLFVCTGILFNHESPLRSEAFVTRKITRAATRIKEGLQEKLFLGNLDAKRDWGYAKDYVEAMWLMLQH